MRAWLGILVAILVVALAQPAGVLPLAAWVRQQVGLPAMGWTLLVALGLSAAACLLPPAPRTGQRRPDYTVLTVAVLLMLEPVLHLAVLAVSGLVLTTAGAQALLPAGAPGWRSGLAVEILIFVVVVPIGEEFFFRGRLLPWLRTRLGTISAVTISAGFFAAAHGQVIQAIIALPVGILLGWMRVRGAGLGACMVAHGVHNSLFLVAGAGLIAVPVVAPALFLGGAFLAAVSWYFHLRPHQRAWRKSLGAFALSAIVIAALMPGWWRLQDSLWARGVHRLCRGWRIDTSELLVRILVQQQRGCCSPQRREHLLSALAVQPCENGYRQVGILAVLAPDRLSQLPAAVAWEDAAVELMEDISARPPPYYEGELARRLGLALPAAFVDTVLQWPQLLPRWLALPAYTHEAALQLSRCEPGRDRRILLTQLEVQFPGQVAAVIVALPADQVTALEIRHLRRHYPDAESWVARVVPPPERP